MPSFPHVLRESLLKLHGVRVELQPHEQPVPTRLQLHAREVLHALERDVPLEEHFLDQVLEDPVKLGLQEIWGYLDPKDPKVM